MPGHYRELSDSIKKKEAKIGVIGLGYVGLPIALRFCGEGFKVTGFDLDETKVEAIKKGRSYIKHIPSENIASLVKGHAPRLTPTSDMARMKDIDAIIICVPTPLSEKREPDLSSATGWT